MGKAAGSNLALSDALDLHQLVETWPRSAAGHLVDGDNMDPEQGGKGGRRRPGMRHPIAKRHGRNLPDRQIARQANFAHPVMDAGVSEGEHDDMPAKKPARPAPTTLRKWRLHSRLTLEQVGNIVGKGAQAVHKWETGKTPVDIETLKLLAQAYGTSAGALLHDPADEALIRRMEEAYGLLKTIPADDVETWLATGRALAKPSKASTEE
jgi:transcriptional regulator with XRE-family HTH domain